MVESKLFSLLVFIGVFSFVVSTKYDKIVDFIPNNTLSSITLICGEDSDKNEKFPNVTWESYTEIKFQDCQFHKFGSNSPKNNDHVRLLNISDVGLYRIETEDFENVTNLETLIASNNFLYEIEPSLFNNTPKIQRVNFSNNRIEYIDPVTFQGCSKLKFLDLANNKLTSLDEHTLENVISLTYLDLSDNPIGNAEFSKKLEKLEVLSLKNTNIVYIRRGTFSHNQNLVSLNLAENNLQTFDFNASLPYPNDLRQLDLSKNQLTELTGFRFENFPKLEFLGLNWNKFNCSYLNNLLNSLFEKNIIVQHDDERSQNVTMRCVPEGSNISVVTTVEKSEWSNHIAYTESWLIVIFVLSLFILVIVFVLLALKIFGKKDKKYCNEKKAASVENIHGEYTVNEVTP